VSKVEEVFARNKADGQDTLVGYFPAGFPNVEESIEACVAMCENGVDVLELGVPYSDPVMDGLVIQQATEVALENGFKLGQIFDIVEAISSRVSTPVLVMTYWNPVMQYGG
jgi:tryptophan synthase alpha chain